MGVKMGSAAKSDDNDNIIERERERERKRVCSIKAAEKVCATIVASV